ncbi:hypothetical protein IY974_01795 [Campylobacter volucris]|uniref:hypothetical protein n=1 Tax=Campylobacter volucris TaxID=1031542 RepID=UPI00189FD418|nr:hypothetical protein [Campylobacter volucris]MBF7045289.1 hypothetical protein [Campylobacter volucris]
METKYISENEIEKLLDINKCVKSIENMYKVMSTGAYTMGGSNANSHGMRISFMRDDKQKNTYIAMPGWLGGEYNLAGLKWHGPNLRGAAEGTTMYTLVLNEPNTGFPLAILPANLITIYRTAALSLYASKLLKNDVYELGLIGAGRIHTVFIQGMLQMYPNIKKIKIKGKSELGVVKLISEFKNYTNAEFLAVTSVEEAVKNSDIISVNPGFEFDNLADMPIIRSKWLKENSLTLCLSFVKFSDDFLINEAIKIADNYAMCESYLEEFGYPVYPKFSSLGSRFIDLVEENRCIKDEIIDIFDILAGRKNKLLFANKPMVFSSGGMICEDIAIAYDLLKYDIVR